MEGGLEYRSSSVIERPAVGIADVENILRTFSDRHDPGCTKLNFAMLEGPCHRRKKTGMVTGMQFQHLVASLGIPGKRNSGRSLE